MDLDTHSYHHKIIVVNSRYTPMRIHVILMRETLMAIGYNQKTAMLITMKTFRKYFEGCEELAEVVVPKEEFAEWLGEMHLRNKLEVVKRLKNYFYSIIRLRLKQQGIIILLGGASGSGKSSLTSLLAGRLHLKEMSTDNIRHIMRNFISKNDSPFIFSSTYDSYHLIKDETKSIEERTIEAYLKQCKEVQRELKKVLDYYYKSGVWVIVEGVHNTPEFIIECMKSYNSCFGCVVYVEDADKYKNRFASRSSKNSIKPEDNKYVAAFDKILMLQDYLVKEADRKKIPKIHNTNLDTSFSLVHLSFLKNLKLISNTRSLITNDDENADLFHDEFMKTTAMINKAKRIRDFMRLGAITKDETGKPTKKFILQEREDDGLHTVKRIATLKPVSEDNKLENIIVVPMLTSKTFAKNVTKHIMGIKAEDPEKVHWVETNKRSIIFKTNPSHQNEQFLSQYILESSEKIEHVITDTASENALFRPAMTKKDKSSGGGAAKNPKRIRKGSEDSVKSFESDKAKKDRRPSIRIKNDAKEEQDDEDNIGVLQENSIDGGSDDNDSQGKEAYDQENTENEKEEAKRPVHRFPK